MTTHSVTAEFFHAYGQTDMKKLIVAIRNFVKAHKSKGSRLQCS